MIVDFFDRKTEAFYEGYRVTTFSGFARSASCKFDELGAPTLLGDLGRLGNRLQALKDRRKEQ